MTVEQPRPLLYFTEGRKHQVILWSRTQESQYPDCCHPGPQASSPLLPQIQESWPPGLLP